jgi:hypothetical protein
MSAVLMTLLIYGVTVQLILEVPNLIHQKILQLLSDLNKHTDIILKSIKYSMA